VRGKPNNEKLNVFIRGRGGLKKPTNNKKKIFQSKKRWGRGEESRRKRKGEERPTFSQKG